MEKDIWSNGPKKQTGKAITISNIIELNTKLLKRDGKNTEYSWKEKLK